MVEKKTSAFDEYDKENGYEEIEDNQDKWVDVFFWIIRYAIKVHKMSYKECMDRWMLLII